jgi:hypothetical protein
MEDFFSEETVRTPRIEGFFQSGKLRIEGRSLPEDAKNFYRPFREWLNTLLQSEVNSVTAEFALEYFNTSTSKILVDIMLTLDSQRDTKQIAVIWEYEEDDHEMAEVGKDFQTMMGEVVQLSSKSI